MATLDYYVTASGVIDRGLFYNYLRKLGYKPYGYTREYMINSTYPFAVCMKKKHFVIIESVTMCYFNQKEGRMITVDKFKDIIESKKKKRIIGLFSK